jgi:phage terminase large subunit GpA-like protein
MLERGEWRATFPERTTVGFHLNALYSPIGLGRSWAWLAARFEEVKRDPARLKVFVNTRLGECYEDPDERLDWEELKQRAEPYALRAIPRGCLVLTAGVDVQKDRLEVQVVGWGRNEQAWVIDWSILAGDPTRPEVWNAARRVPAQADRQRLRRADEDPVDGGRLGLPHGRCPELHAAAPEPRRVRDQGREPARPPDPRPAVEGRRELEGRRAEAGAELWLVGTDSAKHRLFARLAGDRKQAHASGRIVHFSHELPDDFYMQLSAEIFDPNKRAWVKLHGRRNEALDTHIYAMVASMHPRMRVHVQREHDWARVERVLEPKEGDLFAAGARASEGRCRARSQRCSAPRRRRSPLERQAPSWVTGFKGK